MGDIGGSARRALRRLLKWPVRHVETSVDDLHKRMTEVIERFEMVRREVLYEMRYGMHAAASPAKRLEPRVIAREKVAAAMVQGPRLNIGCGHVALDGYVNVDGRELPGVDIVADVTGLPFDPGTVREIFSSHLVEHFPQEQLRRSLLPYWKSLLMPQGVLRAVVPDGEAMLQGVAANTYPFEEFREVLFGAQDYRGDFHYNLLTPRSFGELLAEAGFQVIEVPAKGRRSGKCFEFEIKAVNP